MRSSGVAPVKDHPSSDKSDFAFTAPLGFEHPMARAHVKLLGPCFKTGRRDRRPTRDRDANRASKGTLYKRSLHYPSPTEPGTRGLKAEANKLHPRPRSAENGSSRMAATKCRRRQSCQVIGQTFPWHWPGLGLTSDGAKLSGGVKYYYNICFCFYKAAKLYKASTLFLFFVSHSAEK